VVTVDLETVVGPDFAPWYGSVADGVTRRVSAAVGDPLLGREAAAEAFARAYERWPRVANMESPEGWVYRVAVNICRRSWQQRVLESRALARMLPAAIGASDYVHGDHHHDDVYRACRRLPPRMRTAIRLRYWDDLTEYQVAERMGISPGTVSALLSTGRARLRRALSSDPTGAGGHR
jgi:RNA polymerase sigma factor (sigma-70 family)